MEKTSKLQKVKGTHLGYFSLGMLPCELVEMVFAPFLVDPARVPWDGTDSSSSSGIGCEAAWCVCVDRGGAQSAVGREVV